MKFVRCTLCSVFVLVALGVVVGCYNLQTPDSLSSEVLGFVEGVCDQLPGLVGSFCK